VAGELDLGTEGWAAGESCCRDDRAAAAIPGIGPYKESFAESVEELWEPSIIDVSAERVKAITALFRRPGVTVSRCWWCCASRGAARTPSPGRLKDMAAATPGSGGALLTCPLR